MTGIYRARECQTQPCLCVCVCACVRARTDDLGAGRAEDGELGLAAGRVAGQLPQSHPGHGARDWRAEGGGGGVLVVARVSS